MSEQEYEYGIRHIRSREIHRHRLTRSECLEWMDKDFWDGVDVSVMYEMVRRPVGTWEKFDHEAS
jgi:hypothetical protein